jgi:hypothetical protein
MVTQIKGGYELNLGQIGNIAARDKVKASDVQELLKSASTHDTFKSAKGKFEFRLLERGGEAVLQIKERTFASKYLHWFSRASDTRAEQRHEAMKAINSRFGLGMNLNDGVTGAQARDFAKVQGQHLLQLGQAGERGAVRLSSTDNTTIPQARDMLAKTHASVIKEGNAPDDPDSPLASLFDKKVFGTLTRSNVAIGNDGTLSIGGLGSASSAKNNLETIVKFVEDKTGIPRDDARFKPLIRNLTRNDHFVFASQVNNDLSLKIKDKFGITALSLDMSGNNKIGFDNGAFVLQQSCSGTMMMGGIDFSNEDRFKSTQHVQAQQSFRLNVQDLTQPDFDITAAAQNLQFNNIFD